MKLERIIESKTYLAGRVLETPMLALCSSKIESSLGLASDVRMKLELFQHVGSFKARGVLLSINSLSEIEKRFGVIAVSAGNHALAVAWASKQNNIDAKVLMPKNADPYRIDGCRSFGANVILVENAEEAFELMGVLAEKENRKIMHPFEDEYMITGAATCGLEMITAMPDMDIAIVPVGGGGLIAGLSACLKLVNPAVQVFGVEPYGADSIFKSLTKKQPVKLKEINTIADSLGAPMALPKTFDLISKNVSGIVRISDQDMINSMNIIRDKLNLMVEPACASSLAALIGPLALTVKRKSVALIACGSNISYEKYRSIIGG